MECPTVKVVDAGNEQGFKNINAEDFDPLIHVPFVEPEPEPEPEPTPEPTPEPEPAPEPEPSPAAKAKRTSLPPFPAKT